MNQKMYYDLGLPQFYVAVYLNPNSLKAYGDQLFLEVKLGSTRNSIPNRVRSEGGQLSFSSALELTGYISKKRNVSTTKLHDLEGIWRGLVNSNWKSRYSIGGYLEKENFYIPMVKLPEFLEICASEANNDLITETLGEMTEFISFNDTRRNFVYNDLLIIKESYENMLEVFNTRSREKGIMLLSVLNEFIKTHIPTIETIYIKEKNLHVKKPATPIQGSELPGNELSTVTDKTITKLRAYSTRGRSGFSTATIHVINEVDKCRRSRKNSKWPFERFGMRIGDIIYFRRRPMDEVIPCYICENDYVMPVHPTHDWDQVPLPKAVFIAHQLEGLCVRHTKGRNATFGWKPVFFIDPDGQTSFQKIKGDIEKREREMLTEFVG